MEVDRIPEVLRIPLPQGPANFIQLREQPERVSMKIAELEALEGSVHLDNLRGEIHVQYVTPIGNVGYGITRSAFRDMPRRDAVAMISKQMAEYLVRNLP